MSEKSPEIRIFPASSRELAHERELLAEIVHRLNSECGEVRFSLEAWEYQDASMERSRKQDSYDAVLCSCEVCIAIFRTRAGRYTCEEVELALREAAAGRRPSRVLVLRDARVRKPCPAARFLKKLSSRGVGVGEFSSDHDFADSVRQTLREVATVMRCPEADPTQCPIASARILKVGLATGPGLEDERLAFYEIAERLNRRLAADGLRLELEDSAGCFDSCEAAIAIYWKKLGTFDEKGVASAYEHLRRGEPPHKFYVFFKDAVRGVEPRLSRLKAEFETVYGHFVCRFEHIDSLKLQFAFQFAELCGRAREQDLDVTPDGISYRGVRVAAFDNLRFAARNEKHNQLRNQIREAEAEIERCAAISDGDGLAVARQRAHDLREALASHDRALVELARFFVRADKLAGDARVREARELFLSGQVEKANALLDIGEILSRDERAALVSETARAARAQTVDALLLKVKVSQAAGALATETGVAETIEAYENALRVQEEIGGEDADYADILHDYFVFLLEIRDYGRAESVAALAESVFTALDAANHQSFAGLLGRILNGYGYFLVSVGRLEESLPKLRESISILSRCTDEMGRADAAMARNNYGLALMEMGTCGEAAVQFRQSLSAFESLASEKPDEYLQRVVMLQNNLGECDRRMGRFKEARSILQSTVDRARDLLPQDAFQAHYMSGMAHLNLGVLGLTEGLENASYSESAKELSAAVAELSEAATVNPQQVAPYLALALNDRSVACHEIGLRDEERSSAEAALAEYRRLDAPCEGAYAEGIAMAQVNLGVYHETVRDYEAASNAYRECVNTLDRVEWRMSATMRENMGKACGALAALSIRRGDMASADEWKRRQADARGNQEEEIRRLVLLPSGRADSACRHLERNFSRAGWQVNTWHPKSSRVDAEDELGALLSNGTAVVVVVGRFARPAGRDRALFLLGLARACVGDKVALAVPYGEGVELAKGALPCRIAAVIRYQSLKDLDAPKIVKHFLTGLPVPRPGEARP